MSFSYAGVVLLLGGVLLSGCGKQAPAVAAPAPPTGSAESTTAMTESVENLRVLTVALRRYSMERQRVPQSLDEIVATGHVSAIPVAPAGKKYQINPKRVEVVLVSQ